MAIGSNAYMFLTGNFLKIKKSNIIAWGYAFLFILFIPTFISRAIYIPHWGVICYAGILLADLFFLVKQKHLSKIVLWTFIFFGYFVIITIFQNPDEIGNAILRLYTSVSFVILVEYIFYKYDWKNVISILMRSMEVFNYANLISMVIYPGGMYKVITYGIYEEIVKVEIGAARTNARVLWLLGHQTLLSRFTLPAICIALIYCYVNNNGFKWNSRSVILIAVCIAETIIANSAGNYILLTLFGVLLLVFHFHGKIKTIYIYPIIVIIYSFFLTSSGELALFTWMSSSMQRSVQISTRLPIWINALKCWMEKPIFGWGYINESSDMIRRMLSLGNPHSSYLWCLFEGGVIGLGLLIFVIQKVSRRMNGCWSNHVARIIFAVFLCFLIGMIDDDYIFRFPQELMVFSMVYHIPEFVKTDKANRR